MKRICQIFMIGLVLTLVVFGLNISNEAINQLTASQRPPVIAMQASAAQMEFHMAGQQYNVDADKLEAVGTVITSALDKTVKYLYRIGEIFRVVFLS